MIFTVTYSVRESYEIEADTAEEAIEKWEKSYENNESEDSDAETIECDETGCFWFIHNEEIPAEQLNFEAEEEM